MSGRKHTKQKKNKPGNGHVGTPKPENTVAEQKRQEPESTGGNDYMTPLKWEHKPDSVVSTLTLYVTAIIAIIYFLQLRAMNGQLDILRGDSRARIGVQSIHEHRDERFPTAPIGIGINFVNTGKTPAFDVQTVVEPPKIAELPDPAPGCVERVESPIHGLIQPNQVISSQTAISRDNWTAAVTGIKALYIYGRVEYRDTTKQKHWTTFC